MSSSKMSDKNQKKVIVFGGVTVDVISQFGSEVHQAPDAPPKSNAGKSLQGFGGVGRNVAECIHRFGHQVHLVSIIGNDLWGSGIKRNLETLGMATKGLIQSSSQYPLLPLN